MFLSTLVSTLELNNVVPYLFLSLVFVPSLNEYLPLSLFYTFILKKSNVFVAISAAARCM